jgi:hypothetical protein
MGGVSVNGQCAPMTVGNMKHLRRRVQDHDLYAGSHSTDGAQERTGSPADV